MGFIKGTLRSAVPLIALVLAACGSGGQGEQRNPGNQNGGSSYTIGGTVSGLSGTVVLQNNHGDDLGLSADGAFTFATGIADNATYAVTVLTQPSGQTCSVSTGSGTVSGGNVSNVAVTCSSNTYTVGGTVTGLSGSVVLQNNNGDDLTLSANGAFTFATPLANGSAYTATVLTQPSGQSCSVANGTGTIALANVGNVVITCVASTYTVGGTVSGLSGTVVLQNNGADDFTLAVNGAFTFPTAVASGNPYQVSVLTQPTLQYCSVTSGAGTIVAGNIGNVGVSCVSFVNLMGGGIQRALSLTANVSTFAGTATSGALDGIGAAARFNKPSGIASDGSSLYIADTNNNCIRKVDIATGTVTTLAGTPGVQGSADGTGAAASFLAPYGITTDGNSLYVTDSGETIRKITPASGSLSAMTSGNAVVTTLAGTAGVAGSADGTGTAASFSGPQGITTDGISLYVTDTGNKTIRKITPVSGSLSAMTSGNAVVTTLAGTAGVVGVADGTGTAASFASPWGITTDGNSLYLVAANAVRKITPASGVLSAMTSANAVVTTLAGGTMGSADGVGPAAQFNYLAGITSDGSSLYVAEYMGCKIRKIDIASATVSTLAGNGCSASVDGIGTGAGFQYPQGIVSDGNSLYVSDTFGNSIRKIR